MQRRGWAFAALVLGLVGGLPACASDDDSLTLVMGGDSVMGNLEPGVAAALSESADTSYLAEATISRDASAQQAWTATIEEDDPDLVVLMVGTWEIRGHDYRPDDPDWRERYDREVLDPFAVKLTGNGARMLVIGMPTAREPEVSRDLAAFSEILSDLADRHPSVDFLDAGAYLNSETGGFIDALPGEDGALELARRIDDLGVHLCPPGVVRLAEPVLDWVDAHAPDPPERTEGWEDGDWTRPPELENDWQCPVL